MDEDFKTEFFAEATDGFGYFGPGRLRMPCFDHSSFCIGIEVRCMFRKLAQHSIQGAG